MIRKLYFTASLAFFCFSFVSAQLVVSGGFTAQQLADNLAGNGISVTNAVITGAPISYGTFAATNTNLGLNSGIVLTSGSRNNMPGPNSGPGASAGNGTAGDAQLTTLAGAQTNDACVLEFDFQVESDRIEFRYVFGSDEYPEFVGSFNDVFAFYISGPGIVGQENIALVPGTSTYVSINNIHAGSYWQYYVDNQTGTTLEYDGITTVLTAKKTGLIPCQTYHLKLAVADAVDDVYDTGVFLEENSLVQGTVSAVSNTALGDSIAVEGCTQASFTFSLSNAVNFDTDIPILVGGQAVNGVDYVYIDSIFTIPAGQTSATIFINALPDGITEGIETVQLMYQPRPCEPYDTVMLYIEDNVPITYTATATDALCYGDSTGSITINITGGTPPFKVVLNGIDTFLTTTITNLPAGTYGIEVLDGHGCGAGSLAVGGQYAGQPLFLPDGNGNIYTTSINISGLPPGSVLTNPNQIQFVSVSMEHSFMSDVGIRLYAPNGSFIQLKQRPGGNETNLGEPVANGPVDANNPDTTMGVCYDYFFNNNPVYGTMVSEAGNFTYTYLPVTGPPTQSDKYIPSGSFESYEPFSNLLGVPLNGNWTLWIKDYKPQDNGWVCDWSLSFNLNLAGDTVVIGQPSNIGITASVSNATCGNNNGAINLTTGGSIPPYSWLWSNSAITEDISGLGAGVYTVTVTNGSGCTRDSSFLVQNNSTGFTASTTSISVSCPGGSNGSVDLTVSGGASPWTYLWSNGAVTQDISNVAAGTYFVTITGSNNCVLVRSQTVGSVPGMNLSAVTANEICGQQDGSIDLSLTGGNTPYSYLWSNSSSSQDISFLQAGTYTVTVTDNAGCTATDNWTLVNDVGNCQITCNLSIGSSVVTDENCGNGNGSVNLTPSGGYLPLSFSWSNGAFTEDIYNLSAGVYSCTITDAQGCTANATYTVTNQAGTLAQGTPVISNEICGNGQGGIDITVSGGVTPYTYLWSTSAVTQDISGLNAGNYSVTITDASGCSLHGTYTVANNSGTLQQTWGNAMGETCGNGQGSVDITISGGSMPYTFAWSNGEFTEDIINLSAGNYSCTITDATGCTIFTPVYNVPNNSGTLAITNIFTDNEICSGSNGNIRVIASGGTTPYTYAWSNGATTDVVNNLSAGTYYGTVTDASGCSVQTGPVTLVNDPGQLNLSGISATDEVCGNGNGILNLTASSPAVPLSFLWSNGSTSEDLYSLGAGTYYVTVTDTSGCTLSTQATVQNLQGTLSILNLVVTNETCANGTGAVDLIIAGGSAPVTYAWSNAASTQDISSLHAGSFSVTVNDANGCTVSGSANVGNNSGTLSLTGSSVINTTCGLNNGSIDISISGQTPLSYSWSNGGTGQDLVNLSPGTYSCTITDSSSCSVIAGPYTIVNTSGTLQITSALITDETCNNSAGSIDLTVAGGSGFYTYAWSSGPTTQDLSGIGNGNYTVTVSDGQGCSLVSTYSVADDPGALSVTSVVVTDAVCGASNGAVNLSVSGGGPYTYTWSNAAVTQDLSAVAAGTYSCTITSGGCSVTTGPVTVANNPGSLSLVQISSVDENCGNGQGETYVSVSGGTAPVTYLWSTGSTLQNLTGLSAGVYTVTVSDAGSCQITASAVVGNSSGSLTVNGDTLTHETCGNGQGSIHLGIGGATPPVNFLWNTGASTQNLNNISAGTYTLLISDGSSCQLTWSGTILNNSATLAVTSIQVSDAICSGGNGSIDITVSGGTQPYTYLWSNGSPAEDPTGLNPGNYTVIITDALGCTLTASAVVGLSSGSLTASAAVTDDNCNNGTGSIALTVNGTNIPFSYQWSNGPVTQNISGLFAGTYTVTVTDALGCTFTTTATVSNLSTGVSIGAPVITHETCGNNGGAIDISPSGGSIPYTYLWSNGALTQDITSIAAGTYTVTVTDASGCGTISPPFTVNNNTGTLTAGASITDEECGNQGGAIDLIPSGGAGGYTYQWSNGPLTQDISGLTAGNYTVTLTDGAGCQLVQTYTVGSGQGDVAIDSWVITPADCQVNNGAIDITVSGSNSPFTYAWSNSASTQDISGLASGSYTVTVTDANGCIVVQSFTVSNGGNPILVTSVTVTDDYCSGFQGMIDIVATGGTGTLEYSLNGDPPQNWGTFWGLGAGNYTIVITDAAGCSTTVNATVNNLTTFSITLNSITQATCATCPNGGIDISNPGAQPPVYYYWSNGAFTQDLTNVLPGTYWVQVTDNSFCTVMDTFVVGYSTSTIDPVQSYAEIFPNPNLGVFTLHYYLNGAEDAKVEIFNTLGLKVYEMKLEKHLVSRLEISLEQFTGGVYHARITAGDFETVKKIVVNR